jgi:hypothetical protein
MTVRMGTTDASLGSHPVSRGHSVQPCSRSASSFAAALASPMSTLLQASELRTERMQNRDLESTSVTAVALVDARRHSRVQ